MILNQLLTRVKKAAVRSYKRSALGQDLTRLEGALRRLEQLGKRKTCPICADGSFDLTYCSHVLEHIPDDRLAMRELCRVLRAGGRAIILVPTGNIESTHEDPSVTSAEERARHFGRHDHLRLYGRDLIGRLREAGFLVRTVYHHLSLTPDDQLRYGVLPEPIFDCVKPA